MCEPIKGNRALVCTAFLDGCLLAGNGRSNHDGYQRARRGVRIELNPENGVIGMRGKKGCVGWASRRSTCQLGCGGRGHESVFQIEGLGNQVGEGTSCTRNTKIEDQRPSHLGPMNIFHAIKVMVFQLLFLSLPVVVRFASQDRLHSRGQFLKGHGEG